MRTARIKVDDTNTWYHCYNRTSGTSRDRPFRDADKDQFIRILKRISLLYGVRVVAYQVMSNHYHLLLHAPKETFSAEEMCRRYRAFHRGRKTIQPDNPLCQKWLERSRDISWFMRHLQQLFTSWYNRSRLIRRRGSLWADRFKHTILEAGPAVWACWKYIENNAVRAGMVENAGLYRFCSYGAWRQSGRHPFTTNITDLVIPMLGLNKLAELFQLLTAALEEKPADEKKKDFVHIITHRVRYWVDGLVIGSELFSRNVMASHHPQASSRRIMHHGEKDLDLACWRRLRPAW